MLRIQVDTLLLLVPRLQVKEHHLRILFVSKQKFAHDWRQIPFKLNYRPTLWKLTTFYSINTSTLCYDALSACLYRWVGVLWLDRPTNNFNRGNYVSLHFVNRRSTSTRISSVCSILLFLLLWFLQLLLLRCHGNSFPLLWFPFYPWLLRLLVFWNIGKGRVRSRVR